MTPHRGPWRFEPTPCSDEFCGTIVDADGGTVLVISPNEVYGDPLDPDDVYAIAKAKGTPCKP